jgi:hypothetical protein
VVSLGIFHVLNIVHIEYCPHRNAVGILAGSR